MTTRQQAGEFGVLLRRYRTTAGQTREELAQRAGVSVRGIAALEGGERLAPRRDTVQLLVDALRLSAADADRLREAAGASRPPGSGAGTITNLPRQPTALLGRQQEVAAVRGLLEQPAVRLLTLTGPGGTGKTRLALQVAEEMAAGSVDGVCFVALAPLSNHELVVTAVAHALGLVEVGPSPLVETVGAFLQDRQLLLVLDNFEQVLPAAVSVARLLQLAPTTTVLVTSRAPLRLRGEREWPVPPLPLPDVPAEQGLERLAGFDVVQLFTERAQAVEPGFRLTEDNAAAVGEICRRLDGLPLAVELAAARTRLLTPPALLDRLRDRLAVLVGGPMDAPERQRTLRSAIVWSYDLLSPQEQELFERLAVFAGGRSLEAVEAVCDPGGQADVLDAVEALVANSLLRRDHGPEGEPRLVMLETIQQFAWERLEDRGAAEDLRRRHAEHYLEFAERAAPELVRRDQARWLVRLETEIDNLRTALGWAIDHRVEDVALRLVVALARFWDRRNRYEEGRRWIAQALALPGPPGLVRARVLLMAGELGWRHDDLADARTRLDRAMVLFEQLGDVGGTGAVLHNLSVLELYEGRTEKCRRLNEEAVVRLGSAGPGWEWEQVAARADLALVLALDFDLPEGVELLEEAVDSAEVLGDLWLQASALGNLAEIRERRGHRADAVRLITRVAGLAEQIGDRLVLAYALSGIAALAHLSGQHERAARLWGAEAQFRSLCGGSLASATSWDNVEQFKADARTALGEQEWEVLVRQGRDLPHETVMALAVGQDRQSQ